MANVKVIADKKMDKQMDGRVKNYNFLCPPPHLSMWRHKNTLIVSSPYCISSLFDSLKNLSKLEINTFFNSLPDNKF